jgi:ATP-dependent Clp protease ATP-binding subunit ClpB
MDMNRFTEKAQGALSEAQRLATRLGQTQVDVEHLLLALLDQDQGLAPAILSKADVSVDALKVRVQRELERLPRVSGPSGTPEQAYVSGRLNRLLTQAEDEARQLKDEYISVEHLLLAMIEDTGTAGRILKEFGVTRDRFMRALQEVRGNQRVTSQNPETTYQALERYGRDLTQLARQGKLDPVIGRDEEIRRVIQVLSRRTK